MTFDDLAENSRAQDDGLTYNKSVEAFFHADIVAFLEITEVDIILLVLKVVV